MELKTNNEIKNLYKKFKIYNKNCKIYEDDFTYFYDLIKTDDEDLKNNKNKNSWSYKVSNRIKKFLETQEI